MLSLCAFVPIVQAGLVLPGRQFHFSGMEHIIFLHSDRESDQVLSQAQHSLAQRLVLVILTPTDRPRLSILLRLIRRLASQRAQQLYLVSEDHLLRILAEHMGYGVAITLDAYRGLTPGKAALSRKTVQRTSAAPSFPSARPAPHLSGQRPLSTLTRTQKPGVRLDAVLVDGYLPNPGAMPSLEEEEERAEREEPERLRYEIADENALSQAQEEAEAHEASIIATIRKTSASGSQLDPSAAPANPTDRTKMSASSADPPKGERQRKERPPARSDADGDAPSSPDSDHTALRPSRGAHLPSSHEEEQGWEPGTRKEEQDRRLHSMRTIDELLAERGQADIFEWFAHQVDSQQEK
jgi:hypothetical protein